jgi:hypothetical protein
MGSYSQALKEGRSMSKAASIPVDSFRSAVDSFPGITERDFFRGYVECASWCGHVLDCPDSEMKSPDELGEPYAPQVWERFRLDCRNFIDETRELLDEAVALGRGWDSLGHDFWLSRNGHGAGFFDRGREEVWRKLQTAAKVHGEAHFYLSDGLIHCHE